MTDRNYHQVRREIRLMQQISYTGAVKLLGTFEDLTAIYLVQELCQKGDLFQRLIRAGGVMDEKFVAGQVTLPLLLTLEHLHARCIFHRDIKPENIFFGRDGQLKLGDFGLAIDANTERPKSRVGTLDYMAPEVVSLPTADERKWLEQQGKQIVEQAYTQKVDIWACGILAYELLVGRPPFEVEDEVETKKKIMYENTLRFPPHVSQDAINFIKIALAKNCNLRPTASELVHHAWLRPRLAALAGTQGVDVSGLRQPSLTGKPPGLAVPASTSARLSANVGRSSSFTMPRAALPGLAISVDAEAGGQHTAALPSPTAPTTPGPYGPPGMSRKPIWEMDGPVTLTAVKTSNLSGEVPSSPTSPRVRSPMSSASGALGGGGSNSGGGGTPLLKAALNHNLNRISHITTSAPGGGVLIPSNSKDAAAAQQQQGLSGNVKQRLKDYFVSRNTSVISGKPPQ
eukprot:jgi/Chrzof1/716/Cz01g26040.t1